MLGAKRDAASGASGDEAEASLAVGPCLNEDEALDFAAGSLAPDEVGRVDAHIDRCSACHELIVAAVDASTKQEPDEGALDTGTLLCDRYRIVRFIGRGGMGEIYEAEDTVLGERLALKCLSPRLADNPKGVLHLKSEVQLARRVSHPNVCRVYDFGAHEVAGKPALYFLTMELLPGDTLGSVVRKGPLPLDRVEQVARQLLVGLREAHRAGVLHRDFKSDNVLLRPGASADDLPEAVITDFGLARAFTEGRSHITTSHLLVGSAAYMAPEQIEGGRLTQAVDLYSFGIVVFEMLTGALPFVADTPISTATLRLREPPPKPSDIVASVPARWDAFVLKCLERDPAQRFSSAEEALVALSESNRAAPTPSAPPRLRKLAPILGAACLLGGGLLWRAWPAEVDPISSEQAPSARAAARTTLLRVTSATEGSSATVAASPAEPLVATSSNPESEEARPTMKTDRPRREGTRPGARDDVSEPRSPPVEPPSEDPATAGVLPSPSAISPARASSAAPEGSSKSRHRPFDELVDPFQ